MSSLAHTLETGEQLAWLCTKATKSASYRSSEALKLIDQHVISAKTTVSKNTTSFHSVYLSVYLLVRTRNFLETKIE